MSGDTWQAMSKYLPVGQMESRVSPYMQVGRSIKGGGDQFVEEGRSIKERRRKKKKRERKERKKKRRRRKGERKREKRKSVFRR